MICNIWYCVTTHSSHQQRQQHLPHTKTTPSLLPVTLPQDNMTIHSLDYREYRDNRYLECNDAIDDWLIDILCEVMVFWITVTIHNTTSSDILQMI